MFRNRTFVGSQVSDWQGVYPVNRSFAPETTFVGNGSDGDVVISSNTSLVVPSKSGSYDGDVVVRQYNSLTINSGFTLTTDQPCRGLWIFVKNNCTINGILSMTGRGPYANPYSGGSSDGLAVSSSGIKIALKTTGGSSASFDYSTATDLNGLGVPLKNVFINNNVKYTQGRVEIITIPRDGSSGAPTGYSTGPGYAGGDANGSTTFTGGGGGGGRGDGGATIGAGGISSCFGGGSGSGAARASTSGAATAYGGPGSSAAISCGSCQGGGGAGNPGGSGAAGAASGENGTGGFIVLIVGGDLTIGATGSIQANGVSGGNASVVGPYVNEGGGGGGSGGGCVIIGHKGGLYNTGSITANGGSGGAHFSANNPGGRGGNGTVITKQLV